MHGNKHGVGHIAGGYHLFGGIETGCYISDADGPQACGGAHIATGEFPIDIKRTLGRTLVCDGIAFTYPHSIPVIYNLAIGPYTGYHLAECRGSKEYLNKQQ